MTRLARVTLFIALVVAVLVSIAEATVSHSKVLELIEKLDSEMQFNVADLQAASDEYDQWELNDFRQLHGSSEDLDAKVELLQLVAFEPIKRMSAPKADEQFATTIVGIWKELAPYYLGRLMVDSEPVQVEIGKIKDLLNDVSSEDSEQKQLNKNIKLLAAAQEYRQLERSLREMLAHASGEPKLLPEIQSILSFKNQTGVRILVDIFFPMAGVDMEASQLNLLKKIYNFELANYEQ